MNNLPILLAEDDAEDVRLLRRAFEKAQVTSPLRVVSSGEEALAYLRGEGEYADRLRHPFPALLLLDLKMPGMGGMATLGQIRKDPALRRLVVIILTSSNLEEEINLAFDLRANAYFVKTCDADQMTEACERLKNFWLRLNQFPLPPKTGGSFSARERT